MTDRSNVYAKFSIDKETNLTNGYIISEDKDVINSWNMNSLDELYRDSGSDNDKNHRFNVVTHNFFVSMSVFQNAVPFIMRSLPLMLQIHDDRSIRWFIKKNGELLESGEYETYKIDITHINRINRSIEYREVIQSGINSIPSMFLIGLIGAYDKFLSHLIETMFIIKPEILSSSDRNISFKDLVEIGSIDEARNRIIEKEIETVIRSSHSEQIVWLEKKLNMTLRSDQTLLSNFIEICECRNLLTHTGGIISTQYISVCKDNNVNLEGKHVGKLINIDAKYYIHAVNTIIEFGIKLTNVVWRKLLPTDIEHASKTLNDIAYELIVKHQYTLAITILMFALDDKKKQASDSTRKQMVVNCANALKLSGNKPESDALLNKEDWSASSNLYNICVSAVRDDVDAVVGLMKSVVDSGLMNIRCFREWPVFDGIRSNQKFVSTFEQIFGKKLFADKGSATVVKSTTESNSETGVCNNTEDLLNTNTNGDCDR